MPKRVNSIYCVIWQKYPIYIKKYDKLGKLGDPVYLETYPYAFKFIFDDRIRNFKENLINQQDRAIKRQFKSERRREIRNNIRWKHWQNNLTEKRTRLSRSKEVDKG